MTTAIKERITINSISVGTLVSLKTSFMAQPLGTKCLVYEVDKRGCIGIISETGVNIGYFTFKEVDEHLELEKDTSLNYTFRNALQLQYDFENNVFTPYFK